VVVVLVDHPEFDPAVIAEHAPAGVRCQEPEILAALTLVAFTVVIVQRLLDGSRPPCACFGSRSNKPLGRRHVARNLGLLAVAALAIIGTA
jgi:hypothetical protein